MLISLQVTNFAIIDRVDVEFSGGMTVLTGETGAGKSILVDALGLVLGERGGAGLVRQGSKRAEFTAEFATRELPSVNAMLEAQALDSNGECVLRRTINADGRSRAFVNGNPVPLQTLKSLGEMLIDIHGQHFHQSLGKAAVQRDLLDHFAGAARHRAATESAFGAWQTLSQQLQALRSAEADKAARLDLLTFQSGELDALDLQADELTQLHADRQRLLNSGQLAEGIAAAMQSIYDGESADAQTLVADACRTLAPLADLDASLAPALEMLREAEIQIAECAATLRRFGDTLDMNTADRDRVEERLDAVQKIARKHRIDPQQIPELHESIQRQLLDLQEADALGAKLEDDVQRALERYRLAAGKLSQARHDAAIGFSRAVTSAMADLGMAGGAFETCIRDRAADLPRADGQNDIEYLISPNPGQPPMPLAKIASGGELSRISLAIQVIASDGSAIPTMIFDEVDSGVGGGIAEMVGQRLRDLGEKRQVLCVTHLPQVASLANHHFRLVKISDGSATRTAINVLDGSGRVEEIARMLGGVKITDRTRDHAAEMLQLRNSRRPGSSAAGERA